jgi:hypothetical protein
LLRLVATATDYGVQTGIREFFKRTKIFALDKAMPSRPSKLTDVNAIGSQSAINHLSEARHGQSHSLRPARRLVALLMPYQLLPLETRLGLENGRDWRRLENGRGGGWRHWGG